MVYTGSQTEDRDYASNGDVQYVNGEPVVTTGCDVSRFLVDTRDDGDPALTFHSLVLGTVFAGLGAALFQIYIFKPIQMLVSTVFLLLLIYSAGLVWSKHFPHASWHVIASLVASTASNGSSAVSNFAVQRLYYDTQVEATTAVLATFSTACFGYGLVGLLRPLTVYPSEMVYWFNLPAVAIFQALHFDSAANHKHLKLFWSAFVSMFCFEIIPAYIFPLLNGISVMCLATQHASSKTVNIITNLFGGTDGNEGLGFLSISFDWQYIRSQFMNYPLIQQGIYGSHFRAVCIDKAIGNSWIGYAICYIAIMGIYYSNAWNSLAFPMLSSSIFSSNGSIYNQSAIFGNTFNLNQTVLEEIGLPALTGLNAWANLMANLAIGG
ncbi:Oligopeptide transporter 1 [Grifola frondosa]|uniref:Oligopeptide transporter 1 n=1 Tax=Grifola frondosa TaxID=5627 RepID=A0A1C7M9V0_GRIFR|nr:Oligopeptide transporter 1 [Grifola frondosa]